MLNTVLTKEKLEKTVSELNAVSNSLAIRYLPTGESRKQFYKEINDVVFSVRREISINCLSVKGGVQILEKEIKSLKQQQLNIYTNNTMQYIAIEKKNRDNRNELVLKQIGFVGGGSQVFSGFGVCAASLGIACASFGAPLISHGLNNFYENGYYLIFRKNKQGLIRKGYHDIARAVGYSGKSADYAYAGVDLVLAGYGLGHLALKGDSFRLFRHINSDFIRGWRKMGKVSLGVEMLSDSTTAYSIYQLRKDEE